MPDIFKDPMLVEQLNLKGYAVLPFADREQLDELSAFYNSLELPSAKGTHVTMFNPSYQHRKMVDEKIKQVFAEKAKNLLPEYEVLYTNFMVKEPGPEGDFPLHQDWTYVDETKYRSYAIWVPMHHVDDTNGALHAVEGSHRFHTALRGPHVHEPYHLLSDIIKSNYSTVINLKAGEALIWDHRLVHFSKPNQTGNTRKAFTLIMVPQRVEVFHCFGVTGSAVGAIELYEVNTDFFMRYVIGERPAHVKLLGRTEQPRMDFTLEEFDKLFSSLKIES